MTKKEKLLKYYMDIYRWVDLESRISERDMYTTYLHTSSYYKMARAEIEEFNDAIRTRWSGQYYRCKCSVKYFKVKDELLKCITDFYHGRTDKINFRYDIFEGPLLPCCPCLYTKINPNLIK